MLKVQNVYKKFRRREALHDVSFELEPGIYGLLAPNGAGKTTLLRCILDLYPVTSGKVYLDGSERIGYLPQKFGVFRELKVCDMLYYFATVKKIPKKERKQEIQRVLKLVNLEERSEDRVSQLSGGMQRRLGIAQAVLGNPELLFFDEPTAGLDPEERTRFKHLIREIGSGRTIIISTHIVEDVESLCDRVLIMSKGKLLENVTVEAACHFAKETGKDSPSLEEGYLSRIQEEE